MIGTATIVFSGSMPGQTRVIGKHSGIFLAIIVVFVVVIHLAPLFLSGGTHVLKHSKKPSSSLFGGRGLNMRLVVPPPFALCNMIEPLPVRSGHKCIGRSKPLHDNGCDPKPASNPVEWFTGWLKGVIAWGGGYTCSRCVALYTPGCRAIYPYRGLYVCSVLSIALYGV